MRVRQWAVAGAAFAVAWAGGAGIASADPTGGTDEGCLPELQVTAESEGDGRLPFPDCAPGDFPTHEVYASVGCDGVGVLDVYVEGAEPGVAYTIYADGDRAARSEPFTADEDGVVELFTEFVPDEDGYVNYDVDKPDENTIASGDLEYVQTCQGEAELAVTRDCLVPETLTLDFRATGLLPDSSYVVVYTSAGFVSSSGDEPFVPAEFDTDGAGAGAVTIPVTEDKDATVAEGAFAVDYEVYLVGDLTTSITGSGEVVACTVDEGAHPTTPAQPTQPVAAPVVVQPVAQQPAVLANTGTPTAVMALVGGGLLATGAGALVATRRRA